MPLYLAVNKLTGQPHRVGTELAHVCVETIRVPDANGVLQDVQGVGRDEDLVVLPEYNAEPSSLTHRWVRETRTYEVAPDGHQWTESGALRLNPE